jgi:hypothetical protein
MSRPWFKIYTEERLQGYVRFNLTAEERGVLLDLLALATRFIRVVYDTTTQHWLLAGRRRVGVRGQ